MTEPHTDINAGLVIILGSDHESPIDLANAADVAAQFPPEDQDEFWDGLAAEMLGHNRDTTVGYLRNYNDPIYSTVEDQGKVLQSGLALFFFCSVLLGSSPGRSALQSAE